MSDRESDDRHHEVADIVPTSWERRPLGLATEIREFLSSVKDEGSSIDSGCGDGYADLWVTVQGIEYFINVRKSNNQLAREGTLPPPLNQNQK